VQEELCSMVSPSVPQILYLSIYLVILFLKYKISQYKINNLLTFFWPLIAKCVIFFVDTVMNQVGNSNFPPSGHCIFFFVPTYTMKNKTREIQKNGQERLIVLS
jgi:hypothetical protein